MSYRAGFVGSHRSSELWKKAHWSINWSVKSVDRFAQAADHAAAAASPPLDRGRRGQIVLLSMRPDSEGGKGLNRISWSKKERRRRKIGCDRCRIEYRRDRIRGAQKNRGARGNVTQALVDRDQ